MNILLFLTPKKDVSYLYNDYTIRQATEKMEYHRYTAIPIIDRNVKYIGTLTEGDILWFIKNNNHFNLQEAENEKILNIPRIHDNKAVNASSDLQDIFNTALEQNFIPVVDDNNIFIGIITRKNIFNHFKNLINNN